MSRPTKRDLENRLEEITEDGPRKDLAMIIAENAMADDEDEDDTENDADGADAVEDTHGGDDR